MSAQVLLDPAARVSTLAEALPYIRMLRGARLVVKLGGESLEDPELATSLAEDLALLALVGARLVVVHGGGAQVSNQMAAAGIEPRFVAGLRVTDDAAMQIVRQVLIGTINADLVGRLSRAGLHAVGLSGIDGRLLETVQTKGPNGEDLGHVGRVERVDAAVLLDLLDRGYTPVLASIGADSDGTFHNVNADAVASAVASSLGASKLIFLTNVEGLYRDLGDSGSLISEIAAAELQTMVGDLSDGMRPKVHATIEALSSGVQKVHILDGRVEHALLLEIFTDAGCGTQVVP
ncbi:MAG: acetylglutamate kinase [Actinomycetota bacterium]